MRALVLPQNIQFIERDWLSANHVVFIDSQPGSGSVSTVIDTGYKKHSRLTLALLQRACAITNGPQRIINTHLHSDHCGGNALLQQSYPHLQTYIPVDCAEAVAAWSNSQLSFAATAQDCDRFNFTHTYSHGDLFQLGHAQWQALAAKGHDHTMLMLYCEQLRILISADALWANGFGITFPELVGESGFAEQEQTLNLIGSLKIDWVIPGHGPMFNDVQEALTRAHSKLAYIRADPVRHQYLALKVLVKFLLLDREKIQLTDLSKVAGEASLFSLNISNLGETTDRMLKQVAQDLVKSNAASYSDGCLFNA